MQHVSPSPIRPILGRESGAFSQTIVQNDADAEATPSVRFSDIILGEGEAADIHQHGTDVSFAEGDIVAEEDEPAEEEQLVSHTRLDGGGAEGEEVDPKNPELGGRAPSIGAADQITPPVSPVLGPAEKGAAAMNARGGSPERVNVPSSIAGQKLEVIPNSSETSNNVASKAINAAIHGKTPAASLSDRSGQIDGAVARLNVERLQHQTPHQAGIAPESATPREALAVVPTHESTRFSVPTGPASVHPGAIRNATNAGTLESTETSKPPTRDLAEAFPKTPSIDAGGTRSLPVATGAEPSIPVALGAQSFPRQSHWAGVLHRAVASAQSNEASVSNKAPGSAATSSELSTAKSHVFLAEASQLAKDVSADLTKTNLSARQDQALPSSSPADPRNPPSISEPIARITSVPLQSIGLAVPMPVIHRAPLDVLFSEKALLETASLSDVRVFSEQSAIRPTAEMPTGKADLPRHVMMQLADAAQRVIQGRFVELTLSPVELGRVRMALETHDGLIKVHIVTERAETLDLMRRHSDALAQEFRDIGYGTAEFLFSQGQKDRQQDHDGDGFDAHDNAPEDQLVTLPGHTQPPHITINDRVDIRV